MSPIHCPIQELVRIVEFDLVFLHFWGSFLYQSHQAPGRDITFLSTKNIKLAIILLAMVPIIERMCNM